MIKMTGLALIILGVLALAYQGFTYTQTKQDAQIGDMTIQHDEKKTIPFPPIVGAVFIVAGVAAFAVGNRRLV